MLAMIIDGERGHSHLEYSSVIFQLVEIVLGPPVRGSNGGSLSRHETSPKFRRSIFISEKFLKRR